MSRETNSSKVRPGYVGVNLLPEEIKLAENAATQRRLVVLLTVLVLVLVAAGFVGSYLLAENAKSSLTAATANAERIVAEQATYGGGQLVANQIRSTQDAQLIATVVEVDWVGILRDIISVTPESIVITSFEIDGSTSISDSVPPDPPLENMRIASISMTATTPVPGDISVWIKALEKLDGFAGAPVVRYDSGQATINFFVSSARVTGRFDPNILGYKEQDPAATPTPQPTPEPNVTETAVPNATPEPTPTEGEG
ncbi:MAG: hypothetical protein ACOH1J_04615 [Microbacteriaceae bacterium]